MREEERRGGGEGGEGGVDEEEEEFEAEVEIMIAGELLLLSLPSLSLRKSLLWFTVPRSLAALAHARANTE